MIHIQIVKLSSGITPTTQTQPWKPFPRSDSGNAGFNSCFAAATHTWFMVSSFIFTAEHCVILTVRQYELDLCPRAGKYHQFDIVTELMSE